MKSGGSSNPGIKLVFPVSPSLAARFFTIEPPRKPFLCYNEHIFLAVLLAKHDLSFQTRG